jgi:hypothetical protein
MPQAGARIARMPLDHFAAMCDDTGLFQHAVYGIPDRITAIASMTMPAHAAVLASGHGDANRHADFIKTMQPRFAAFIQHGWNPDKGRFRNFMGYDRRWLEDAGSEDSHGRTLWALGACMAQGQDTPLAQWACGLLNRPLPRCRLSPRRGHGHLRCWVCPIIAPQDPRTARRTDATGAWRPTPRAFAGLREQGLGMVRGSADL